MESRPFCYVLNFLKSVNEVLFVNLTLTPIYKKVVDVKSSVNYNFIILIQVKAILPKFKHLMFKSVNLKRQYMYYDMCFHLIR